MVIELNRENLKQWEKLHDPSNRYVTTNFRRKAAHPSSAKRREKGGQVMGSVDSSTQVDSKAKRSSEESKDGNNSNSLSKDENKNSGTDEEEKEVRAETREDNMETANSSKF